MTIEVLQRVVRRETHSPRTVVVVLVLVVIAAVYTGVEIVRYLLGASPVLAAPGVLLAQLVSLPETVPHTALLIGGAVVAVLGGALLWFALSPGRRPKHRVLHMSTRAVVVDNGVIASAVAESVRRELDLPRGRVAVGVSHRVADVIVRPEPGQDMGEAEVRSITQTVLASYEISPALRVRARIEHRHDSEDAS